MKNYYGNSGEDHYTWDGRLLDEPDGEPAIDSYTEGLIQDELVTERELIARCVEEQIIANMERRDVMFSHLALVALVREVADAIRRGEYGR